MTALDQYQRLEAAAIWYGGENEQRRDVIVAFGEATLTISSGADIPVAHWSLAAVKRLNPGERPALFSPGPDHPERLEVADDTMVDAIRKVQRSIDRGAPHPKRLRLVLSTAVIAVLAGLAAFWLPGAMVRYTVSVVPPAKSAEIGQQVLGEIGRLAGQPCTTALGRQALADMLLRLSPQSTGRIFVLRSGGLPSRHLPGDIIMVNRAVVEDYDDPNAAAGFVLAELERAARTDPLQDMLSFLGLRAAFGLLTRGDLTPNHLAAYAEHVLTQTPAPIDDATLLTRFKATGIPSTPYAFALDITGEATVNLIEADPVSGQASRPVLTDGAWVSLQSICSG
jgi:hypothetical protein